MEAKAAPELSIVTYRKAGENGSAPTWIAQAMATGQIAEGPTERSAIRHLLQEAAPARDQVVRLRGRGGYWTGPAPAH